jgi:hypothetical protein
MTESKLDLEAVEAIYERRIDSYEWIDAMSVQVPLMVARIRELEEALRWYADADNWQTVGIQHPMKPPGVCVQMVAAAVSLDNGKRAREVLNDHMV